MSKKIEDFINQIRDKKIHLVGFSGTEGAAIAFFLHKWGLEGFHMHDFSEEKTLKKHFRNAHIALDADILDQRYKDLLNLPVQFHFKDTYLEGIQDADIIFVPQSWYLYDCNNPLKPLQASKQFLHITKLYFHLTDATIIGVTGSNGKTTTSNLIHHIIQKSGTSVYFSGNDRGTTQILDQIEAINSQDILLLEVSNRQLKIDLGKSPHIAVITNITPNHLKEYDSFDEYKEGKESIIKHQDSNDFAILNQDDEHSQDIINRTEQKFTFSVEEKLERGAYINGDKLVIKDGAENEVCAISDLQIKGKHNLSNALAAVSAAHLAGIGIKDIATHLKSFKGVAQRQELMTTIQDVQYYNDSSSTSPESLIAALDALQNNIILIAGGRNKGLDSQKMCQEIAERVKELVLIDSPFADEIKEQLPEDFKDKVNTVETLKEAVELAHQIAQKGDKVILSPGAEYFVYFKDKMKGYKNYRTFVKRLESNDE